MNYYEENNRSPQDKIYSTEFGEDHNKINKTIEVNPLMTLKETERTLARQLKKATLKAEEEMDIIAINKISDFEYAQHAITILANPDAFGGFVDVTTGIADEDVINQTVQRIARLQ